MTPVVADKFILSSLALACAAMSPKLINAALKVASLAKAAKAKAKSKGAGKALAKAAPKAKAEPASTGGSSGSSSGNQGLLRLKRKTQTAAVVIVDEVQPTLAPVHACSRMLNYLKYQADPQKNKKGTAEAMGAASAALEAAFFCPK